MKPQDRIREDRKAIERLRRILSNMDPHHRRLQAMGGEMMLTCDSGPGAYAEIAVVLPDAGDAERDFLLFGPADALAALRVIDRATAYFRSLGNRARPKGEGQPDDPPAPRHDGKKYGSECAMLCNKQAFRRFVAERYGADASDEASVVDAVKKHLAIDTRVALNHDPAAAGRWLDMRADYHAWLQI